jgi:hypothetical protein
MEFKCLKVPFACAVFTLSSFANAGLIINITELAGNVQASYSGTINLNATDGFRRTGIRGFNGYNASQGIIAFTVSDVEFYGVDVSTWAAFGTDNFGNWDVSNGNALALFSDQHLGLEAGYISGNSLSGTATKSNSSFAELGFSTGSYLTTFTNGNVADTVRVNIGQQVSVPEPSTLAIFALGLMGLVSRRFRK